MPRVESRPLTEAHSPALATRHRAAHQQMKDAEHQQPEAQFAFKAQPLNKKILEGPVSSCLPAHMHAATSVQPCCVECGTGCVYWGFVFDDLLCFAVPCQQAWCKRLQLGHA